MPERINQLIRAVEQNGHLDGSGEPKYWIVIQDYNSKLIIQNKWLTSRGRALIIIE